MSAKVKVLIGRMFNDKGCLVTVEILQIANRSAEHPLERILSAGLHPSVPVVLDSVPSSKVSYAFPHASIPMMRARF
jgi:hypothetical protein